MTTATARIGFVGLGRMGGAMATRLLAAGFPVSGTARTRAHADGLVAKGVRWRETPREAAESAGVVITSVPDDAALDAVASGPDGLLAGLGPSTTWVDMSTVSTAASLDVAERARRRGAAMLDAPVSGSVPQAQAGTLTIMVGGEEDAYGRVEPILRELGSPAYVGSNGHGLAVKLAINISLAVQMLALAEGLVLAERSGVDRERALGVMLDSQIGSPLLKLRAEHVFQLQGQAWFDLDLMRKDIELALAEERKLGVPAPTAERADEVLAVADALGYGRRDLAALYEVLKHMPAERGTQA